MTPLLPATPGSPVETAAAVFALSLLPFAALGMTSFLKLSIVFGIFRNALGAQQVPSNSVIGLLSLILTLHIMAPVGERMLDAAAREMKGKHAAFDINRFVAGAGRISAPLQDFLRSHSSGRERSFFASRADPQRHPAAPGEVAGETLFTLIPAFVISEISEAFYIGFAVYLPFLVVDIIVINVLIGLGMMMVSPLTISLPLKIILFVSCDGWFLLCRGLILSYR